MADWLDKLAGALVCGCVALLLVGCDSLCDPESQEAMTKREIVYSLKESHPVFDAGPNIQATEATASTATVPNKQRLVMKAIANADAAYKGFPNKSYGKFTAQVTICVSDLTGLQDQSSMGLLEFHQAKAADGPRRFYLGAMYDAAHHGLTVIAGDPASTDRFGRPVVFAGKYEVDLRIQQTDTELLFFARETPAGKADAPWTEVYTAPLVIDPAFYHVYIGVRNLKTRGSFCFTQFAIDGDAVGGTVEYPVIALARDAAEALRAAKVKLSANPPDLAGADTDLNSAVTNSSNAISTLQATGYAAQQPIAAGQALTNLKSADKILSSISAAVKTQNTAKARAVIGKLEPLALVYTRAMGELLGWSVPALNPAPELFSLRIP